jgi:hypothetical protein
MLVYHKITNKIKEVNNLIISLNYCNKNLGALKLALYIMRMDTLQLHEAYVNSCII